jgi:IS1 family transposase
VKRRADFHDANVRNVKAERVQFDEIWSFCYAKEANAPKTISRHEGRGDVWTWMALDADSKLIITWTVGDRDSKTAYGFMCDLKERLANRVQLTSDGLKSYVSAVGKTSGDDVDFAQLVKIYGPSSEASAATARQSARAGSRSPALASPTRTTSARLMWSGRTLRCGCICAASPA